MNLVDSLSFDRFKSKVLQVPMCDCWIWTGAISSRGYGTFWKDSKNKGAHVASYEFYKNTVPVGKVIRHTCDTPHCVNPDHLLIGDMQDNMSDMKKRGRSLYGKKNPQAKLDEDIVLKIRKMSRKEAMDNFNVSSSQYYRIVKKVAWSTL